MQDYSNSTYYSLACEVKPKLIYSSETCEASAMYGKQHKARGKQKLKGSKNLASMKIFCNSYLI
jgi:hypothetical protein